MHGTMHSLRNEQRRLQRAILAGNENLAAGLLRKTGLTTSIHANHFRLSLYAALSANFPAVRAVVGDDCFAGLARSFILATPPGSPCLFEYGESLADHVAAYPPCRDLPYLQDLARFEWLLNHAAHVDDTAVLRVAELSAIRADRAEFQRFIPHPAAAVLESPYPVDRIRHYSLDAGAAHEGPLAIDGDPVLLLVTRPRLHAEWRRISSAEAMLFVNLQRGMKLGAALADGLPDPEAAGISLMRLVEAGAFCSLVPDYSALPVVATWRLDDQPGN
ncbi:MAG: DNA-binding domain-containing protein [Ferrovibrio sp.]